MKLNGLVHTQSTYFAAQKKVPRPTTCDEAVAILYKKLGIASDWLGEMPMKEKDIEILKAIIEELPDSEAEKLKKMAQDKVLSDYRGKKKIISANLEKKLVELLTDPLA